MDGGGPFPGMSTSGNSEEIADAAATDKKSPADRRPGEWNWEGVWEQRVEKAIAASLSEPVLYGGVGAADDVVSLSCLSTWMPAFLPGGSTLRESKVLIKLSRYVFKT